MTASNISRSAFVAAFAHMARACGITLAELADALARPVQPAPVVDQGEPSAPAAPQPAQRRGPALSPQAQQILEFASRAKGAIVKDFAFLLDVDYSTAAYHCDRLVGARLLTKVKVRGEHAMRYWSNPAHALAYVEAKAQQFEQQLDAEQQAEQQRQRQAADRQREADERAAAQARQRQERAAQAAAPKPERPTPAPKPAAPPPKPQKSLTITPPKADDATVRPKGEAIFTEKTVETIDTTKRANNRLEATPPLPPDPRFPSFSSMRPGVDPCTGKAWEPRA